MRRAIAFLALFILGVTACGGVTSNTSAREAKPPSETKSNGASAANSSEEVATMPLDAALAREAEGELLSFPIQAPSSAVAANVVAKEKPLLEEDTTNTGDPLMAIKIPIGSDPPIECFIRSDRVRAGEYVHGILTNIAKHKATIYDLKVDVLAMGDAPAFFVDIPFIVEQDGKKRAFLVKSAVVTKDFASVMCVHEQVGYRKTFRRVVESIAKSLYTTEDIEKPTYSAIAVDKVGDKLVGYSEYRVFLGPAKTHSEVYFSVQFIRRAGKVFFSDREGVIATDHAGEVLDLSETALINGKHFANVQLKRLRPKQYSVDGVEKDQPFQATFSSKEPIETDLSLRRKLEVLKPGGSATFTFYSSVTNPKRATRFNVSRATNNKVAFAYEDGTHCTCELDDDGTCAHGACAAEPDNFVNERIFKTGKL